MSFSFVQPWALYLLPLCLVPMFLDRQQPMSHSSLAVIPKDRLSDFLNTSLRVVAVLAIALLTLSIGGIYRPAQVVERIGKGAQIVLLLDRSRSMDQPFAGEQYTNPLSPGSSKGDVARALLSDFAAGRRNDMFGMTVFSTRPIRTLPLTDKQPVTQAAIHAGNIGRGLAETNVGGGLIQAIESFAERRYTGSRIVMLISDGGAKLDQATRSRIEALLLRHRVALYWIYVRSRFSPGISDAVDDTSGEDTAPARALHKFFASMQSPYRVYDAENPQALERAIADVGRLQNLPIHYSDLLPRRDLSSLTYLTTLVLVVLLCAAKLLEVKTWR